jgi:hypothetical protein
VSFVTRKRGPEEIESRIISGGLIGINAWANLVARQASLNAPVDTSHLANSIFAGSPNYEPPTTFWNDVSTAGVPYARAQEMGSGLFAEEGPREKYPIWAGIYTGKSSKKALSFSWPGGPDPHPALQTGGRYAGRYTFAKIMHPGVKPKRYLRNALESEREEGISLFLAAVNAALA